MVQHCARVLADAGKVPPYSKVLVIGFPPQLGTSDQVGSPALQIMDLPLNSGTDVGFPDHHLAGPIT